MSGVLVINSGSSSLKYQFIDTATEEVLAKGLIERIGQSEGVVTHEVGDDEWAIEEPLPDHDAAFAAMIRAFDEHGPSLGGDAVGAIGHRVVHGGARFFAPTIVTPQVERDIDELAEYAPLHNPANLAGIRAAGKAFPGVEQVTVFDTAFHQTMPPEAYTYAIDDSIARRYRIRRYGFHGTSHKYVSERAAAFLGLPLEQSRLIVLHLGNGASACAVENGRSVDTSMGFTPLQGLVMGTRSGDLDPAIVFQLARFGGLGLDELDELLNKKSGMLGLTGTADMRDVTDAIAKGDPSAKRALDVYTHRIKQYVGSYLAVLGGADAIVFTAGVGENAALVRAGALAGLEGLGIQLDADENARRVKGERRISAEGSRIPVLVIPTNEELEIARQTVAVVAA
ncbi:acetate/propionate family kinase [Herbiconiux sp. L3-i23]|uniref:acetate/propionate family kinase n=1 Tax=Herbiconiux sp. L3-i23 TaxID=2905871 RepID=UPI002063DE21|nr:acetate kinase [Herbiconiux sp. L3-i23]BDI21769.1 acetate kinase [Herbiconiux sp. L3-i23]